MKYTRYIKQTFYLFLFAFGIVKAQVSKTLDWHYLESLEYENGELKPGFGLSASTFYTAGANSKLEFDDTGDLIFESLGLDADQYMGLSERNFQERAQESEYAIRLTPSGNVYIYVNGISQGIYGTHNDSTKFKISKKTDGIYFYKKLTTDVQYQIMDSVIVGITKPLWPFSIMRGNATGFKNMTTTIPDPHYPVLWDTHNTNIEKDYGIAYSGLTRDGRAVLSAQKIRLGEAGTLSINDNTFDVNPFHLGLVDFEEFNSELSIRYGFIYDGNDKLYFRANSQNVDTIATNLSHVDKARMILSEDKVQFYYGANLVYEENISEDNKIYQIGAFLPKDDQELTGVTTSITLDNPEWSEDTGVNYIDGQYSFYRDENETDSWETAMVSEGIAHGGDSEVWLEAVSIDTGVKFFGFCNKDTVPHSIKDFYYGFYPTNNAKTLSIYEVDEYGTVNLTRVTPSSWSQYEAFGLKLRMRLIGDKIYYYANEERLHMHTLPANHPLLKDIVHAGAMIHTAGSAWRDVRYGVEPLNLAIPEQINLEIIDGLELSNTGAIYKSTNADAAWDGMARASNIVDPSTHSMTTFSGLVDDKAKRVGLSHLDYPTSGTLSCYFDLNASNNLAIYANGQQLLNYGPVSTDDVLKIETENGQVFFYVNDRIEASYAMSYNVMYPTCLIYDPGGRVKNMKTTNYPNLSPVRWDGLAGFVLPGSPDVNNSVGAAFRSLEVIEPYQDGLLEGDIDTASNLISFGFSDKQEVTSSSDITYGFYKHSNNIYLIQNGIQNVSSESWVQGEKLRLEKTGNQLRYYIGITLVSTVTVSENEEWCVGLYQNATSVTYPVLISSLEVSPPDWTYHHGFTTKDKDRRLKQVSTATDWSSKAKFSQKLDSDFIIDFRVPTLDKSFTTTEVLGIGLFSDGDTPDIGNMAYGLHFADKYYVYENGVKSSTGDTFNGGMNFQIKRVGNVLTMSRNGQEFLNNNILHDTFQVLVIGGGPDIETNINITVSVPTSGGYTASTDIYDLKRTYDASCYDMIGLKLPFRYREWYESGSEIMKIKIYGTTRNELYTDCDIPLFTHIAYDYYEINFNEMCDGNEFVNNGIYYLEVENDKGEKRVMRFKKIYTGLPQ